MSDYTKHFIDQGAILVGKTKTGQFASAKEWTHAQPPVNPRGDGKQPPGGAGSGAAAAMAGYDWLAYSIGTGGKSNPLVNGVVSNGCSY